MRTATRATRTTRIALASLVALVLLPGAALACSIAVDETNSVPIRQSDVRVPIRHESARGAWVEHASWISVRPSHSSYVAVAGRAERVFGIAYRQQRHLSFYLGYRQGLQVYRPDADAATPACGMDGTRVWTRPKLLTRATAKAVFVTGAIRRVAGDATGCVVRLEGGGACEDLGFGSVYLEQQLGDRRLVLDWFPAAAAHQH